MTSTAHLDDYGLYVAAVVAGLTALGWLLHRARRGLRVAVAFFRKVSTGLDQLENNGGSSMRDKLDRVADELSAVATVMDGISDTQDSQGTLIEVQGTQIDEVRGILLDHLGTQAEANKAMWPAVEAIANATPHD